jgi:hypothetical protein
MYDGIKFCMKRGEEEVTDFMGQKRRVRQGYSLIPYLFNDFRESTDDISNDNSRTPTNEVTTIQGLIFADDMAISFIMVYRKQQTK